MSMDFFKRKARGFESFAAGGRTANDRNFSRDRAREREAKMNLEFQNKINEVEQATTRAQEIVALSRTPRANVDGIDGQGQYYITAAEINEVFEATNSIKKSYQTFQQSLGMDSSRYKEITEHFTRFRNIWDKAVKKGPKAIMKLGLEIRRHMMFAAESFLDDVWRDLQTRPHVIGADPGRRRPYVPVVINQSDGNVRPAEARPSHAPVNQDNVSPASSRTVVNHPDGESSGI